MNIVKFKKEKDNKYKLYFDNNEELILYDDTIVKYNLLSNKTLNNSLYKEILYYNSFLSSYYLSIKYIMKKLRTESEIRTYLKDQDKKLCDDVISLLKKNGYLNEDLYLKSYISDKYGLTNDGPIKIKSNLLKLGFIEEDIYKYLNKYEWNTKLSKLIDKKIKLCNKDSNYILKQKIIKYFNTLGYNNSDINSILDNVELKNDDELLKNELIKVRIKYSKKYFGDELKSKVINSLYRKGFNISKIKVFYEDV